MAVTNNVPNSTDNSTWQSGMGTGDYWYLKVTANNDYKFDGTITATYTDTSGQPQTLVLTPRNAYEVWAYVHNTDENTAFVITGNTRLDNELDVTNNIPNTTATGVKNSTRSGSVNVTADEGFKITSAKVAFTGGYGYPASEDMTIGEDGKTASWSNDDFKTPKGVKLTGETASDGTPEITVVNNITNTLKEEHIYDGDVATITVESNHSPKYRFIDPKASYKSTDGEQKTVDMEVEVLSYYSLAKVTITDLDPTDPVTLMGKFVEVVHIETNFSNCYADPTLPEFLQFGKTLNITIKANENTAFDTEQSTPNIFYYDEQLKPTNKYLSISEDKQTATGSLVLQNDWNNLSVNAQAYPVSVVGQQHGAINVYLVTLDDLEQFSAKRFVKGKEVDGTVTYETIDLGAYVNRIRRIYTNIAAVSTDVIRCGNYNTGVTCKQPNTDKITLDFGTAQVPAHNEDNTDYESEIQVFLPFAGFVNLNNNYAGKTISLQYVINVITGNGVAKFSYNGVVFQVVEIKPSSEIIYLTPSDTVKTIGGDEWNEMLYYGLEPYIYCKWYEGVNIGRNNDIHMCVISDLTGFNVFDDVTTIHTPEMLTEEQELIYRALSDGVYI